jgi:hypothetical protein
MCVVIDRFGIDLCPRCPATSFVTSTYDVLSSVEDVECMTDVKSHLAVSSFRC